MRSMNGIGPKSFLILTSNYLNSLQPLVSSCASLDSVAIFLNNIFFKTLFVKMRDLVTHFSL